MENNPRKGDKKMAKSGKRREPGDGTIHKRTDGRWEGRLRIGFENGKMLWKYIYGKTWREVSDQLKADQHAQQQGLPIIVERQTVAEFMQRWLEDSVHPRVRPKTYDSYARIVRLYIEPELGHIQMSKLSPPGNTAASEQNAQERAFAAHREILPCSSKDGTGTSV